MNHLHFLIPRLVFLLSGEHELYLLPVLHITVSVLHLAFTLTSANKRVLQAIL